MIAWRLLISLAAAFLPHQGWSGPLPVESKPLALIYRGPGSCVEDCSESLGRIAESVGYRIRFVGPQESDLSIFRDAEVWMQPGGRALKQNRAMSSNLKREIVRFVERGGGYVGFCAGAFLASQEFGWGNGQGERVHERGLGFFPGFGALYSTPDDKETEIIVSDWAGQGPRHLYWELGPVFAPHPSWTSLVEIVSRYPDQRPATLRRAFGKGRVFVTAFHPEAPQNWRDYTGVHDADGTDEDLVREMIRWVNPVSAL